MQSRRKSVSAGANPAKSVPGGPHQNLFDSIKERLVDELPPGPYLSEQQVMDLWSVDKKTLQNDRSSREPRYPPSVSFCGARHHQYPRAVVIDWMAQKELISRTRRVHFCI
jgi:hypothetical protein